MIELINIGSTSIAFHWSIVAMIVITWVMALLMWYWRETYTPYIPEVIADSIKKLANRLKTKNDKNPTL